MLKTTIERRISGFDITNKKNKNAVEIFTKTLNEALESIVKTIPNEFKNNENMRDNFLLSKMEIYFKDDLQIKLISESQGIFIESTLNTNEE